MRWSGWRRIGPAVSVAAAFAAAGALARVLGAGAATAVATGTLAAGLSLAAVLAAAAAVRGTSRGRALASGGGLSAADAVWVRRAREIEQDLLAALTAGAGVRNAPLPVDAARIRAAVAGTTAGVARLARHATLLDQVPDRDRERAARLEEVRALMRTAVLRLDAVATGLADPRAAPAPGRDRAATAGPAAELERLHRALAAAGRATAPGVIPEAEQDRRCA